MMANKCDNIKGKFHIGPQHLGIIQVRSLSIENGHPAPNVSIL